NENGEHRKSGRATHQWSDEDGDDPLLPVVDGPRRHDRRNSTGHAGDQRNDALAIEPELAHHLVHQEDHARHVSRLFQYRNESEQYGYLRDEDDDTADARYNALCDQIGEWTCRKNLLQ